MYGYKHYIRINGAGTVVYGFSSAFEQPQESDILYAEDAGRQFTLQLIGERYQYRYKWENGDLIERSQTELDAERASRPEAPPTPEQRIADLEEEIINLMLALTQVYEEKEADKAALEQESVDNMLAITEIYEMLIGGN